MHKDKRIFGWMAIKGTGREGIIIREGGKE